ncbi:MAG: hypothetical protein ABI947_00780 [Chloroflexota bacterium]
MEVTLSIFKTLDQISHWGVDNIVVLLIIGSLALAGLIFLRTNRIRPDRVERVFSRAGVKFNPRQADHLRQEITKIALDTEFKQAIDENRQATELAALHREKERILSLVQNTPGVVKEVGQALHEIEQAYERGMRTVKSEQAREGLRLTAEKQINDVLVSVGRKQDLPEFCLNGKSPSKTPDS